MDPYLFIWNMLAWSLAVAGFPPLTIPWGVMAFKIWHGTKPIDEELSDELWSRSWRASVMMFLAAIGFLLLDFVAADWLGLPVGPVHIVFLVVFLAAAAGLMMHYFSMEDFFQGLSMTILYLYIPAALLVPLWWLIGWNPLFTYVLSWLVQPKP
jgi:hypothetical protein